MHVADAITEIFTLFRRANKYIDETMPWALAKDENKKARLNDVLYNLAEAICIGASLLSPFLPETSGKILSAFRGKGTLDRGMRNVRLVRRDLCDAHSRIVRAAGLKALEPEIEKIRAARLPKPRPYPPPLKKRKA